MPFFLTLTLMLKISSCFSWNSKKVYIFIVYNGSKKQGTYRYPMGGGRVGFICRGKNMEGKKERGSKIPCKERESLWVESEWWARNGWLCSLLQELNQQFVLTLYTEMRWFFVLAVLATLAAGAHARNRLEFTNI